MTLYLALPDWQQGPISGGHRYNRDFAAALPSELMPLRVDLPAGEASASLGAVEAGDWLIVDTLYQRAFEQHCPKGGVRALLLVHLLAEMTGAPDFSDAQPWPWLSRYRHFLVTGAYARDYLIACGVSPGAITVIEPMLWPRDRALGPRDGALTTGVAASHRPRPKEKPMMWLTVANLQPVKGVLAMLTALKAQLPLRDSSPKTYHNQNHSAGSELGFVWQLYGSHDFAPDYARECRELVASCPRLSACIQFYPNRPAAEAEQSLQAADLVLSAAQCETYGMAVAEAASLGKPVIAVARGNIPYLLKSTAGPSPVPGPSLAPGHSLVASPAEVIAAALARTLGPAPAPGPDPALLVLGHSKASFKAAVTAFARNVLR